MAKNDITEVTTKELQNMYDFLCKHMGKNYWCSATIDVCETNETRYEVERTHPSYVTLYISVKNKSLEDVFKSVFHEYMHLILSPIGVGFRGHMAEIKDKLVPFLLSDLEAKEEGIIYALTETLTKILFELYKKENGTDTTTV